MLTITGFGVTCELEDPADEYSTVAIDHLRMTRQEAETAGLITPEERPARGFRVTSPIHTSRDLSPRAQRRLIRRSRRKKCTAVRLTEFADLSDGRRVIVRSDRGFSSSWKHSPGPFHGDTQESFVNDIHDFFADEELTCCPFSPEWVIERLQRLYGLEIDPASIRAARQVPLKVELGPRLLEQLLQSP